LDDLSTEAGESVGVVDLDGGSSAATGSTTRSTTAATGSITTATSATESLTTATLSITAGSIATGAVATSTTETTTSTVGLLDESLVNLNDLLLLALTLALGLGTSALDEGLLSALLDGLGVGPLLVVLAAFVGLAGLGDTGGKGGLLLGLLDEVVSVGDAVVLGLGLGGGEGLELVAIGVDGSVGSVLNKGLLLVGLGDLLTRNLIFELGLAFGGTPSVGSLLLGVAIIQLVSYFL
jgi:hypothetical protein